MENEQKTEQKKEEWKDIESDVWNYENKGDTIDGIYVGMEPKNGDMSAKYFLQNNKGEQSLVWGSAIIDSRMKLVNIGERVRIVFDGKTKNKKNQDLNLFRVARLAVPA
jgi:hypothetical protein